MNDLRHWLMLLCAAVAGGLAYRVWISMKWELTLQTLRCALGVHDMKNTEATAVPYYLHCRTCGKIFNSYP